MEVDVKNGKLVYTTERPKETCCEFFRGGCKATTQVTCRKCRFVQPVTVAKADMLEKYILSEALSLEVEVTESTHYGEM